jgi:hypothetical protein
MRESADAWTRSAVPVTFAKMLLGLEKCILERGISPRTLLKGFKDCSGAQVPTCPVHLDWLHLVQAKLDQLGQSPPGPRKLGMFSVAGVPMKGRHRVVVWRANQAPVFGVPAVPAIHWGGRAVEGRAVYGKGGCGWGCGGAQWKRVLVSLMSGRPGAANHSQIFSPTHWPCSEAPGEAFRGLIFELPSRAPCRCSELRFR